MEYILMLPGIILIWQFHTFCRNLSLSLHLLLCYERRICRGSDIFGATSPFDTGFISSAELFHITLQSNKPLPDVSQYPSRQEAMTGIHPVITSLLSKEIIVPTRSSCNTPIVPVKKNLLLQDKLPLTGFYRTYVLLNA
ncbi:hypothetical protein FKM82_017978 [Ascaphus truei]